MYEYYHSWASHRFGWSSTAQCLAGSWCHHFSQSWWPHPYGHSDRTDQSWEVKGHVSYISHPNLETICDVSRFTGLALQDSSVEGVKVIREIKRFCSKTHVAGQFAESWLGVKKHGVECQNISPVDVELSVVGQVIVDDQRNLGNI